MFQTLLCIAIYTSIYTAVNGYYSEKKENKNEPERVFTVEEEKKHRKEMIKFFILLGISILLFPVWFKLFMWSLNNLDNAINSSKVGCFLIM